MRGKGGAPKKVVDGTRKKILFGSAEWQLVQHWKLTYGLATAPDALRDMIRQASMLMGLRIKSASAPPPRETEASTKDPSNSENPTPKPPTDATVP